jgi:PPOX class probable F420-dependent enzyme
MRGLDRERYISLATYRRRTPVWFAETSDGLYVFTAGSSGKVKRLRNSSRARVAACDGRGRLRGEWIDARARVVADPGKVEQAYAALRSKYGLQMRVVDFFSRLSGRIDGRAIVEVEF